MAAALATAAAGPSPAQVLTAPGESTEIAFRRQIRGYWFAWLSAQEEGDAIVARSKIDEILKYAQKIEIRRITDLALSATVLGRRQLEQGKPILAREAFQTATRLDPDLPEPRWARVGLAARSRQLGSTVSEFFGAVRATLADGESRRIFATRFALVLVHAGAVTASAFILVLLVRHGRRWFHDLAETAFRLLPGGRADYLLVGAMALAPLLLSFDILWYGLFLFVVLFGYATWPQKLGSVAALALVIPLFPVLDYIAYDLAVNSSPIVRGAEALAESRYDQRVLDNLEAAKVVLPDDADLRFLLGRLYQALGQNDRAIAEYTTAAQLSQKEARSLINRGNIRFVDGDLGSAQEDYQEALRRDPRNVAARYNLALLFAETFRTVEAAKTLNEARALDLAQVQAFQDAPTLVRVVSRDYPVEAAKEKMVSLESDPRGRRLLGHFRGFSLLRAWMTPLLVGIFLAVPAALLFDRFRLRGRGYASECQKCGRTFCRLCKPPGESALLCSQCIHVYLKKDGVAIETKLQKLEDVKRRKSVEEKVGVGLNLLLPGSSAFLDSRALVGIAVFFLFVAGVIGLFSRASLGVVPRLSPAPALLSLLFWGGLALTGWILGQTTARRA